MPTHLMDVCSAHLKSSKQGAHNFSHSKERPQVTERTRQREHLLPTCVLSQNYSCDPCSHAQKKKGLDTFPTKTGASLHTVDSKWRCQLILWRGCMEAHKGQLLPLCGILTSIVHFHCKLPLQTSIANFHCQIFACMFGVMCLVTWWLSWLVIE